MAPLLLEHSGGEMKKLLFMVVLSAAAFAVWRKVDADRAATQPWASATDKI